MSIADKLTTIAENQEKVYDAGKKSEYDAFWDSYQNYGKRDDYLYAFSGNGWDNNTFKPKYDIIPSSSATSFQGFMQNNNKLEGDLEKILIDCGVRLDTSKAKSFTYAFWAASKLTKLPYLDMTSATSFAQVFGNMLKLQTLHIKVAEHQTYSANYFLSYCTDLTNFTVDGTIGQNGFDAHWSTKLSKESIKSVVNALSTTTSGLTVKLSKTAKENAFTDEEWATLIETKQNWTITLA